MACGAENDQREAVGGEGGIKTGLDIRGVHMNTCSDEAHNDSIPADLASTGGPLSAGTEEAAQSSAGNGCAA